MSKYSHNEKKESRQKMHFIKKKRDSQLLFLLMKTYSLFNKIVIHHIQTLSHCNFHSFNAAADDEKVDFVC